MWVGLVTLLTLYLSIFQVEAILEITEAKCACSAPHIKADYCTVFKEKKETYLSAKVTMDVVLDNFHVNLALLKKAKRYEPFLFNTTVDACEFLKNPNTPFIKHIYAMYKDFSNVNHTCPYKDGFEVDRLPASHMNKMSNGMLPLPKADYKLFCTLFSDKKEELCTMDLYFKNV